MSTDNVLLTLVVPHAVEDVVLDVLLAHPETVHGFTTTRGEGHGVGVELVAPMELVRGSSPRMCIRIVGARVMADATVALLKEELPGTNLYYWIVPVLEAGRI